MAIDWHKDFNPTEKPSKKRRKSDANITDIDSEFVGFTAPPQGTGGGIFQYITKINGNDADVRKAQAQLSQLTPETAAVYQTLNILPEGGLKSWLMANPVQFWKKIIQLFTGRKYQTGQYILGERYNDQIICNGNISRSQVTDDSVPVARSIFTILFGVRINDSENLDSLDGGVDNYYKQSGFTDVPRNAVERAVMLKKNYYPISTYNTKCWDVSWFEKYPLVAPIPEMNASSTKVEDNIGKLYNGPLPGGAMAVNGVIPIDAKDIVGQDIGGKIDTKTGTYTSAAQLKAQADQKQKEDQAKKDLKKYLIGGGIGLVVVTAVIIIIVRKILK